MHYLSVCCLEAVDNTGAVPGAATLRHLYKLNCWISTLECKGQENAASAINSVAIDTYKFTVLYLEYWYCFLPFLCFSSFPTTGRDYECVSGCPGKGRRPGKTVSKGRASYSIKLVLLISYSYKFCWSPLTTIYMITDSRWSGLFEGYSCQSSGRWVGCESSWSCHQSHWERSCGCSWERIGLFTEPS